MSEETQVNLDSTGQIELPKLDLTPYVGRKVQIIEVTEHEGQHGYYIKVMTEPVDTLNDKPLQASQIFGLQQDENGKIGWGAETKLGNFLKKMKVEHYKDLPKKEVVVQLKANKNGTEFLSFA